MSVRKKLSDAYNLAVLHPALAQEWNREKNGQLQPQHVYPNAPRKVWWRCSAGHEWQTSPNRRVAGGTGCPYCNHNKASAENNAAVLFPHLVQEWHPPKNPGLILSEFLPGSGKKVWWKCGRGHEWKATIKDRARNGTGCPRCHSHSSQIELRVLTELRAIWGSVQSSVKIGRYECDVYLSSYSLVVEIDGKYWHRDTEAKDERKGLALAKRGLRLVRLRERGLKLLSENDVPYRHLEPPKDILNRLLRKIRAVVPLSEEDQTKVAAYLSGTPLAGEGEYQRLIVEGPPIPWARSLASYSDVAATWHPEKNGLLTPDRVYARSPMQAWWKCSVGHEWRATVQSRTGGGGCIRCLGRVATPERNLRTVFPDLVAEWHPTKNGHAQPESFTPYSNEKVWWLCPRGHEWQAMINNRANTKGCPYCTHQKASPEHNLLVAAPQVAVQWDYGRNGGVRPEDVLPKSNRKAWWCCPAGHSWYAVIASRAAGSGCPACAGFRLKGDSTLGVYEGRF